MIKIVLLTIFTVFFINISQTQAETYSTAPLYEDGLSASYLGFAQLSAGITQNYLSEVGYDANNIDLDELTHRLALYIYEPLQGNYDTKVQQNLAYYESGRLYIGCGNQPLISFSVANICEEDTTKPIVYARDINEPNIHPSGEWQKPDVNIKLYASDAGTGLDYAKYIWDEPSKCISNGITFEDGDDITFSEEGVHTLYVCAGDQGNECSNKNTHQWEGIFRIDSCDPGYTWNSTGETCEEDIEKICYEDGITSFKSNGDFDITTIYNSALSNAEKVAYTYGSEECGFECKAGTWNSISKECEIAGPNKVCYEDGTTDFKDSGYFDITSIHNSTLSDAEKITYTYNSDECGFKCLKGEWNSTSKECEITSTEEVCYEDGTTNFKDEGDFDVTSIHNSTLINATKVIYIYGGMECGFECKEGTWNSTSKECESDILPPTTTTSTTTTCPAGDTSPECIHSYPTEIGTPFKNLLAQNYNYRFLINTPENASPIAYVKYQIEDENTGDLGGVNTLYPSSNWTFYWPMTKVDNDRLSNGAREYTLRIIEICDEAGNCSEQKDYIHNVYANTTSFTNFGFNPTTEFTNGKIADGTNNQIKAILKGKYLNQIVEATGINRTIDFNFNTSHNLNANQFNNNGNAIELNIPNDSVYSERIELGTNITKFDRQESNNGEYNFNFKIYAPTNILNDSDDHDFMINKVLIDINQLDLNPNIITISNNLLENSSVDFNFKPLYTTEFTGEQINGLVEGAGQQGTIEVNKENNTTTSLEEVYLEKDGRYKDQFNGSAEIGNNENFPINTLKGMSSFITNTQYNFISLFTLIPGVGGYIDDIKYVHISSWIGYTNTKDILYKSTLVGENNNQTIAGLKIKGISNIDDVKQTELTRGQDEDIKNLNGEISKASLRKDIRKNAYEVIKNIQISNNNYGQDSIEVGSNYIYYNFKNSTESNKIKILNVSDLETDKTIIISGGNLLITPDKLDMDNILYSTTGNKLPGIIVLKDEDGKGGKVYIDPEISRLDAIIYMDKSLLSYKNGELSPLNGGTYDLLKKQLYIHGSVFSENTIGGSRLENPICPFYLGYPDNICSLDEAQKYDLNYLRRGIVDQQPGKGDYPVIIEYNSKLQLNPPALFSN